jgi:hypothetical protein
MISGGSVWLSTGDTEPVEVQLFDKVSGSELLGAIDIVVSIRRIQDGKYYDWLNDEFRIPAAVAQLTEALVEVDATRRPGLYRLDTATHVGGFDTSKISNPGTDDIYDVNISQATADTAGGLPIGFEIKMGALADKIAGLPANVAAAVWDALQADHKVVGSFGDMMRRIVALQKEHYYIDNTAYNDEGLLISGRIRLFETKAGVNAATYGGTGEGEFATYTLITTPKTVTPERAHDVRSVRDA